MASRYPCVNRYDTRALEVLLRHLSDKEVQEEMLDSLTGGAKAYLNENPATELNELRGQFSQVEWSDILQEAFAYFYDIANGHPPCWLQIPSAGRNHSSCSVDCLQVGEVTAGPNATTLRIVRLSLPTLNRTGLFPVVAKKKSGGFFTCSRIVSTLDLPKPTAMRENAFFARAEVIPMIPLESFPMDAIKLGSMMCSPAFNATPSKNAATNNLVIYADDISQLPSNDRGPVQLAQETRQEDLLSWLL